MRNMKIGKEEEKEEETDCSVIRGLHSHRNFGEIVFCVFFFFSRYVCGLLYKEFFYCIYLFELRMN